jgi:hypothetical protein
VTVSRTGWADGVPSSVSLVLSGVSLAGAEAAGATGLALIGAAAFFRTAMFAVFLILVADYYGRAYSSENYAAPYTVKLFGGVFTNRRQRTGDLHRVVSLLRARRSTARPLWSHSDVLTACRRARQGCRRLLRRV